MKTISTFPPSIWMLPAFLICLPAVAQNNALNGELQCGPSQGGAPAFTEPVSVSLSDSYAISEVSTTDTEEHHELIVDGDGTTRFNVVGYWKNRPERRWRIYTRGRVDGSLISTSGSMYSLNGPEVVRDNCTVKLKAASPIQLPPKKSPLLTLDVTGDPLGPSPSSLPGGLTFREWALERGLPWSFKASPRWPARQILNRGPSAADKSLVQDLKAIFLKTRVKAVVLVDEGKVVDAITRPDVNESTLLPSASMSKTMTALAVGKAICEGQLNMATTTGALLSTLVGTDIGQASLRQVLLMSSRSAETEVQHTHGITFEETRDFLWSRQSSLGDLVASRRLSRAKQADPVFDYKSTDPYLAVLMTQKATGVAFTQWLSDKVLSEAGVGDVYALDTDRQGNFLGTGGVRLSLADWVRVGIYIQEQRDKPTCFGKFVREMSQSQISAPKVQGVNGYFSGYSYFTWTQNDMAPNTAWAAGHFGQRIGWSTKPNNARIFITFGDGTDPDMNKLYPLANRWLN